MSIIEDRLAGRIGGRVLDVATAGGWFVDTLKDALESFEEIIGIDITDKGFEDASERLKEHNVRFIKMDASKMSFDDGSFDTVAMSAGMHHLENVDSVLFEMFRVLKPGGMFILREMYRDVVDARHKTDVIEHDWYARTDRLLGKPHFPTLTRSELLAFADKLGLTQIETGEHTCDDCPRSRGEKTDEEIRDMDEQLAKLKDHTEYDSLKGERDLIVDRIRTVGVACQPALDVVGIR